MIAHEEDLRVVAKVLSEFNVDLPHGYQRVQARAILDALAPAFARAKDEGVAEAHAAVTTFADGGYVAGLDPGQRGVPAIRPASGDCPVCWTQDG